MTTVPFNATITQQMADVVVHHPHLKQRQVHFDNRDGRITIKGSVNSYFEKQLAQEALRNIQGITSIENKLEVEWK